MTAGERIIIIILYEHPRVVYNTREYKQTSGGKGDTENVLSVPETKQTDAVYHYTSKWQSSSWHVTPSLVRTHTPANTNTYILTYFFNAYRPFACTQYDNDAYSLNTSADVGLSRAQEAAGSCMRFIWPYGNVEHQNTWQKA